MLFSETLTAESRSFLSFFSSPAAFQPRWPLEALHALLLPKVALSLGGSWGQGYVAVIIGPPVLRMNMESWMHAVCPNKQLAIVSNRGIKK